MRRLVIAGLVLVVLGATVLMASTWFHGVVSEEYAQDNPLDNSGPCEGMSQDREVCGRLKLAETLQMPGWFMMYLGSMALTVGIALGMTQSRLPAAPVTKGVTDLRSGLCPYCSLRWIPESGDYYCNHLKKRIKDIL